jgi:alginate O-acetyltransferase complex protein AlgI
VASRRIRATRDLPTYLTYVSFFAQLVAGPIVRFRQVAPDLATIDRRTRESEIAEGIGFFVVGLAKKAILADEIGRRVDPLVLQVGDLSMLTAWLAAIGFGLQIYFDFSGYTDMAIGLGRLFGIHLPQNFNAPYRAAGIADFWRRWHISLSSWLRDYLYIGLLGGNRLGPLRTYLNIAITMLLGGLWHGANWTFVVWGAYHGALLIVGRLVGDRIRPISPVLRVATFVAVIVGWVFFRAPDLGVAMTWLGRMAAVGDPGGLAPGTGLPVLAGFGLAIVSFAPETWDIRFGTTWRWALAYAALFVSAYIFMSAGTSPFIYYQF